MVQPEHLPPRGDMGYWTPNIDRIGKEGAMFTCWYGQQSCTAGRAAFITGQSPIRTGLTKVGWRSRFSKGDNPKIYQIPIVARRVGLELSLRYFLSVAARHWNPVPVVMKIHSVGESLAYWKKFARRLVVLGLQNNEKGTVLARHSTLFSPRAPAYISATVR